MRPGHKLIFGANRNSDHLAAIILIAKDRRVSSITVINHAFQDRTHRSSFDGCHGWNVQPETRYRSDQDEQWGKNVDQASETVPILGAFFHGAQHFRILVKTNDSVPRRSVADSWIMLS